MAIECDRCVAILNLGYQLDRDAADLQRKVDIALSEMVEKNNEKWREYARICNIPIIGNIYMNIRRKPDIENTSSPYFDFRDSNDYYRKIREGANLLEELKEHDLEHWGVEEVISRVASEQDADPMVRTRKRCCSEEFFKIYLPLKYMNFYPSKELTMDFETGKLVPNYEIIDRDV